MELNEYLYFLRRAFDGMIGALEELGDELANTVPPPAPQPWPVRQRIRVGLSRSTPRTRHASG
ncbi:hypothetical protein ACWDWU_21870, partial [Streptomyces sp. NPDC003442]